MKGDRDTPILDENGEHESWCPCKECRQCWPGEPVQPPPDADDPDSDPLDPAA